MNFEGFKDLIQRVVIQWYSLAKKEIIDMDVVNAYLANNPFSAQQTPDNEMAYEKLMDVRIKLYELSYEIDKNHDAYMEFMEQALDKPDLLAQVTSGLCLEEKHLVYLELMIMEQVADWEVGTGRMGQESGWDRSKRYVVTLPDGKTQTIGISQAPQKRYWFGICPVSSKIGNLKMCGGCKMVGYVGKEEQKEDWPNHKKVCKILQEVRSKGLKGESAASYMKEQLNRTLTQYELDMTTYPRACMVCDKSDSPDELKNCRVCFCVAFCQNHLEDGKKSHEAHCAQLRVAADDYKNEQTLGHQVQNYVPNTGEKYIPLPEGSEKFFAKDLNRIVSNKVPGYPESELRYLTFLYTCPLTTLYGLQVAGLAKGSLETARSLTIHLVGVRIAEFRHVIGWEIIVHRLPKLMELNLVFIGDECPLSELPKDFTFKSKEIQQTRKDERLRIRYILVPKLYQDYAKQSSYLEPDAVVALDCGFKFYPSWHKAFPHMLRRSGAPLIFTEFTQKDQEDNVDLICRHADTKVNVVQPPQKNPYQSLRPVRCSDKTGNYQPHSVIYTNDYISIAKAADQ